MFIPTEVLTDVGAHVVLLAVCILRHPGHVYGGDTLQVPSYTLSPCDVKHVSARATLAEKARGWKAQKQRKPKLWFLKAMTYSGLNSHMSR